MLYIDTCLKSARVAILWLILLPSSPPTLLIWIALVIATLLFQVHRKVFGKKSLFFHRLTLT